MLGLLCVMYLITYVDRVNIATAAPEIKRELALSNTQLAFILSAFGYPYIVFQVFGGWLGDRVGPRRTLFVCGLIWTSATILTGFAGTLDGAVPRAAHAGRRRGRDVPRRDARNAGLDGAGAPWLRPGNHACVRARSATR